MVGRKVSASATHRAKLFHRPAGHSGSKAMLSYPIWFPPPSYRGNDRRKRAKVGEQIQVIRMGSKYVNEVGRLQSTPIHHYSYRGFAATLRLDADEVREYCMVDGGHNGVMVLRDGLTFDQAMAELEAAVERESCP